ncbi:MAG: MMPL family transporter [Solirubrobacteraceae bacterium]
MRRLLTFGVRRPRAALAGWLVATAVLAALGLSVQSHLSASTLGVAGSESAREFQLFDQRFGRSVTVPILLEGPATELDRQGPTLSRALASLTDARVISPWDRQPGSRQLRPTPTAGLIVVSVDATPTNALTSIEPNIRQTIDRLTREPVTAHVSGLAAIGDQLEASSVSAVHRAELIAIPIIAVVLLVVFGSFAAALIPAVLGAGTVLAGFGMIDLLGRLFPITEAAISFASMMGLALGVDYSLLVVSRFRDELGDADDKESVRRAATAAAVRAGRTVAFAGGAVGVAMLCALVVSAGTLLLSAVLGVIVVVVIGVLGTVVVAPAALVVFGRHVRRHRLIARPTAGPGMWARFAERSLGRPMALELIVAAGLLALAWPALSLATGPPDARQLPPGSAARKDFDELTRIVGAGWASPFEMIGVVTSGTITTQPRLDALAQAQRTVRRDLDVVGVLGPGALAQQARPLLNARRDVRKADINLKRGAREVTGLVANLGLAAAGAQRVQAGFASASQAIASLLSKAGGGTAAVAQLHAGLRSATGGAAQIDQGLVRAQSAAGRIAKGSGTAARGAARLASSIDTGLSIAGQLSARLNATSAQLKSGANAAGGLADPVDAARRQLAGAAADLAAMQTGRLDPQYAAAAAAVAQAAANLDSSSAGATVAQRVRSLADQERQSGVDLANLAGAVTTLQTAAGQLSTGAHALRDGIVKLRRAQEQLAAGIGRLAGGDATLVAGLTKLSNGTASLGTQLAGLRGGAGGLVTGLDSGRRQTSILANALGTGRASANREKKLFPDASALFSFLARTPGVFTSGYLVLAALDGSRPNQRSGLAFALNIQRDGQAARLLIVPRSNVSDPATRLLRGRLEQVAHTLGIQAGAETALGGPAAELLDYASASQSRIGLLIGLLVLVTFLVLVPVFRSLFVPLIGVVLNLATVGAAFGALSVLTRGAHPALGGPGYVDAVAVSAMFTVIFGLSIDYQVFVLMRMREGWLQTGDLRQGIAYGVARTARVITGAAAIMAGVFLVFATADVATIRQLGVGLAIAVLLDATVVRLFLLPAALRAGGRFTWWLPAWLDRALPSLDIGAERRFGRRRPEPWDETQRAELAAAAP